MRKIPEKALAAARKFRDGMPLRKNWGGICYYTIIDATGKALIGRGHGDICHAGLSYDPYDYDDYDDDDDYKERKPNSVELVINGMRMDAATTKEQKEAFPAYLKWLLQESPLAKFIIEGDDLSSILDGGAIIDAKRAGYTATLFICKAMRYCIEEQHRPVIWFKLVNKGVDPLVAMIACSVLNSAMSMQTVQTHCSVMVPPRNAEELRTALERTFEDKKGYKSDDEARSGKTGKLFGYGTTNGGYYVVFSKDWFNLDTAKATKRVDDGWGGFTEVEVAGSKEDAIAAKLISLTEEARKTNDKTVVEMVKGAANGIKRRAAVRQNRAA